MDTSLSSSPSPSSSQRPGTKLVRRLNLSGVGPLVTCALESSKRKRRKRKSRDSTRKDFETYLRRGSKVDSERLDKLRNDLQDSIERTVRIELAFVKELNKHALSSNRVKKIIKAVGEVPFHSDLQRKIVGDGITTILKSENEELKRQRREELQKEREYRKSTCLGCSVPEDWIKDWR